MGERTNRPNHNDKTREKIQVSQIINRLQNHVFGKLEMSATQLKAAEILLRKKLPDLSSVEHVGEVTNYVIRAPEPVQKADEWAQRYPQH